MRGFPKEVIPEGSVLLTWCWGLKHSGNGGYVPRLRGQPARAQLGQPFYGWLDSATMALEAVSTALFKEEEGR